MIICIGKSCGSAGHEIGKLLASRLGYAYYDQEMLERDASQEVYDNTTGELDVMYARSGEDVSGVIGEIYESGRRQILAKNSVVLQAAANGNCVIDMNCADYVLKEAGLEYISIFVTAPFEDRVERKKEELGKDSVQTMTFIKKENLRREHYYNYITGGSWGDPSNYDICVNSSARGIEKTAEMICGMVEKL